MMNITTEKYVETELMKYVKHFRMFDFALLQTKFLLSVFKSFSKRCFAADVNKLFSGAHIVHKTETRSPPSGLSSGSVTMSIGRRITLLRKSQLTLHLPELGTTTDEYTHQNDDGLNTIAISPEKHV